MTPKSHNAMIIMHARFHVAKINQLYTHEKKQKNMKNIFLTLFLITFSGIGELLAQNSRAVPYAARLDSEDVFNVSATIIVLIVVLAFIITVVRQVFENKIKNKIIDKGISESQISAIFQANSGDAKYVNIKWFMLMAGLGLGLTIIHYTMPLGVHSLAIMAFSVACSFLGYHYFLQRKTRK